MTEEKKSFSWQLRCDGAALFSAICARSEAAADAAYDAGTAFHLTGDLARAVHWYERAAGVEGKPYVGRIGYEALQGLVLALGEQRRWDDAHRELDAYAALYRTSDEADWYRDYVLLRTGGRPRSSYDPALGTDPFRYIGLESELARGVDPRAMLRKIDDELLIASETKRLVLLTKAEALRRAGRLQEAFETAQEAYRQLLANRGRSALDRAGFGLAEERGQFIARQLGVRWHSARMSP